MLTAMLPTVLSPLFQLLCLPDGSDCPWAPLGSGLRDVVTKGSRSRLLGVQGQSPELVHLILACSRPCCR